MAGRRPGITRRRLAITHRLLVTEAPAAAAAGVVEVDARARLAVPAKRRWWWPWAWAVAVLLHVAAIVLFILIARQKPPEEAAQSPPGVSVVFQNGGAPQTAAPPAPLRGPSTPAQAPQQPPPPPPQAALEQPEVNLNMPQMPFAEVPSAPAPPAPAAPRPRPRPAPPQHYVVMNGMSYGNPSPPLPNAQQAMNLSLPMSDAQAVNAPELTIKGEIGADWEAELDKWVNEHKYYPQAALEQDQQGNVQIEFTVDRAGNVTGLHMLGSSGSTFLDQAWLGLFGDNTLPPFPAGTKADHITVDATMHYELIQ